jgi:hypothetical protein
MKNGELHFDSLKESRGWYFVEYSPPIAGNPFALVQLTILSESDTADSGRIATAMDQEMSRWLERYGVPVMASAFDAKGDLISLKPSSHLMGRKNELGQVDKFWGLFEGKELPLLLPDALREIYHDIPFRTTEEIRAVADSSLKRRRFAFRVSIALLILWLVVIPVTIELLGVAHPVIGVLVLIYSLWKAFVQLMKILGKWPEGRKEKEHTERKRRMDHYFWHCERNAEGFQRLKIENFEREEREQIVREAAALEGK